MASFLGEFRDVLQKGEDLPSLPAVVFELYAALDDDLVSVDQIASIIERDPGLATRLLRLANSAAFNCGDPIGDLTGAVHLLGVRQVRALCIALSVTNMFQTRSGGLLGTDFWDHSAGVAVAARELGLCLGYHEIAAGELYVAGLLHDVGLLVMDQRYRDQLQGAYDIAEGCDSPLWMGENICLSTDHGELGGLLLGRWDLPASIVSMVTVHHNPKLAPVKYRDACWLIYAAEIICGGLGPSLEIERHKEQRALKLLDHIRDAGYDVDRLLVELHGASKEFAGAVASV